MSYLSQSQLSSSHCRWGTYTSATGCTKGGTMHTESTIMMVDSVCIVPPLVHPVAEVYVPQRQCEEDNCDCDKYYVWHVHLLNFERATTAPVCGRTTKSHPGSPCSGPWKRRFVNV